MSEPQNQISNNKTVKRLIRTVRNTISEYRMLESGDSVLVAVSGGPDSIALLHILQYLAPFYHLRLGIAHLNHCLRGPESDRDESFTRALSADLNLPLYTDKVDVNKFKCEYGLSLEEAARKARYSFFDEISQVHHYNKIALGHHGDDNAESVLMHLLRGSGPAGLSAIPPIRQNKYIRPLINTRRSDILSFINDQGLSYVTDTSNTDLKFVRNRIRHELMPILRTSFNPNIVDTLNRLASVMRLEDEWIEGLTQSMFEGAVVFRQSDRVGLSLPYIKQLPQAARRRIVRKAIADVKGNLKRISTRHIDDAIQLAVQGHFSSRLDFPGRTRILKTSEALWIIKEAGALRDAVPESSLCPEFSIELCKPGMVTIEETGDSIILSELAGAELPQAFAKDRHTAFFDRDAVQFPIVIRNPRPGDRFSPLGLNGSQKLKKFFIDHKVPHSTRLKCPLLVSGGKIIWVAGHRLDNSVRIQPTTRRVLKAEL